MTFVASVVAKNGVAVIADSLLTASRPIIEFDDFNEFLKKEKQKKKDISINLDQITQLFKDSPSHTKNYEDKLFQYDKYTSITTTGATKIDDKPISAIIEKIIDQNKNDKGYPYKKIETRVDDFVKRLKKLINKHIKKHDKFSSGINFIITNYNRIHLKTSIFRIEIPEINKKNLEDLDSLVSIKPIQSIEKVVCDGQNRMSERILLGDLAVLHEITPQIIKQMVYDLDIDETKIPKDYAKKLINQNLTKEIYSDIKLFKLTELSLQQAVDLAGLLMKLEVDIQTYTENIPTAGGLIKLAVIDKKGFRFIKGEEIMTPQGI